MTQLFYLTDIQFYPSTQVCERKKIYNVIHISIVRYNIAQTIPCNYQDIWALILPDV